MPLKAMNVSSDSFNPVSYGADERPALSLSLEASQELELERQEARAAWFNALLKVPAKVGPQRTIALNRADILKRRYEELLGHPYDQDKNGGAK